MLNLFMFNDIWQDMAMTDINSKHYNTEIRSQCNHVKFEYRKPFQLQFSLKVVTPDHRKRF
jgi:hypothetical protein